MQAAPADSHWRARDKMEPLGEDGGSMKGAIPDGCWVRTAKTQTSVPETDGQLTLGGSNFRLDWFVTCCTPS